MATDTASYATLNLVRMESCDCKTIDPEASREKGKYEITMKGELLAPADKEGDEVSGLALRATFGISGFASDDDPSEADPVFTIEYVVLAGYKHIDGAIMDVAVEKENMPHYLMQTYTATRDPISNLLRQMGFLSVLLPWQVNI